MEILRKIIIYAMKLLALELLVIIVVFFIITAATLIAILLPILLLSSRAKIYTQGAFIRLKKF